MFCVFIFLRYGIRKLGWKNGFGFSVWLVRLVYCVLLVLLFGSFNCNILRFLGVFVGVFMCLIFLL